MKVDGDDRRDTNVELQKLADAHTEACGKIAELETERQDHLYQITKLAAELNTMNKMNGRQMTIIADQRRQIERLQSGRDQSPVRELGDWWFQVDCLAGRS
jgi:chromosome segregation ATPase